MFIKSRGTASLLLLGLARFATSTGDFMIVVTLALTLEASGASGFSVSAVLLAGTLPAVVASKQIGNVCDRADSRLLLLGVGLTQAGICLALAVGVSFWFEILMLGLLSIGNSASQATIFALLPHVVRASQLPRATAFIQTASSTGLLIAPAVSGFVLGSSGSTRVFVISGLLFATVSLAGLGVGSFKSGDGNVPLRSGGTSEVPQRAPAWKMSRQLSATFVLVGLAMGSVSAINVVDVFFVRETLSASVQAYGILGATWMAGLIGGAAVAGSIDRKPQSLTRDVIVSLSVLCLILGVAAVVPSYQFLLPLWIAAGFCNGFTNVSVSLIVNFTVEPGFRASAFARLGAWVNGTSAGGYVAAGLGLLFLSPRATLAVIAFTSAIVVYFGARRIRKVQGSVIEVSPTNVGSELG